VLGWGLTGTVFFFLFLFIGGIMKMVQKIYPNICFSEDFMDQKIISKGAFSSDI